MARLPIPGDDKGTWGTILNEYLSQIHNSDGTLKNNVVTTATIASGAIQESHLDSATQAKFNTPAPTWNTLTNKPVVVAAGNDQASARAVIGAGTSNLTIDTTSSTAAAGDDSRLSDTRIPTDNSVTSVKLQDGSVVGSKIADGAVASNHLTDASVQETKLASAVQTKLNEVAPGLKVTSPRHLRRWHVALSDGLYGRAPICWIGDSTVFGVGSDGNNTSVNRPQNVYGIPGHLRSIFSATYGDPGEGFIFPLPTREDRVTGNAATGGNGKYLGPNRGGVRLQNGTYSQTLTIPAQSVSQGPVTSVGIIVDNLSSGGNSITYTKNGGSVQTVTSTQNSKFTEFSIAATNGDTLVFSNGSGQTTYIAGFVLRNKQTGIPIHRMGVTGYVTGDALGGETIGVLDQTSTNQIKAVQSAYQWESNPGLLIVQYGLNDQSYNASVNSADDAKRGITAAKYQSNLQTICDTAVADGWCVLLLGQWHAPSPGSGDTEDMYRAARQAVALGTDHVAAIEIQDIFGSAAQGMSDNLYVAAGSVHLSRKGYGRVARVLATILTQPYGESTSNT